MITKYTFKNIDRAKYTTCLENALNYRIYAELWYLDIVSPDGYDILVLNNFEAVMPIPYQRKLSLKFVIQPLLCQQLGVFYQKSISDNNFLLFFTYLKKYKVRSYNFNEDNRAYFLNSSRNLTIRDNQILPLNQPYDQIYLNFGRYKKKLLKKKNIENLILCEEDVLYNFSKLEKEGVFFYFKAKHFPIIKQLLEKSDKESKLKHYSFINPDINRKTTFLWTLNSGNRIIILLSTRIKDIEIEGSSVFLLNYIIQKHINKDIVIDFEGSMIPGVASFNKGFGAETKQYISYKNISFKIL